MKPNASIITFLTISDNNKEFVFFIYIKEVEELAPSKIYWYPTYGQNGVANYLWVPF